MKTLIQNPELEKLLAEVSDFRAQQDMTKTRFGLWAVNDPNLLRDIEAGRDLRFPTIYAIRQKMTEAGQ